MFKTRSFRLRKCMRSKLSTRSLPGVLTRSRPSVTAQAILILIIIAPAIIIGLARWKKARIRVKAHVLQTTVTFSGTVANERVICFAAARFRSLPALRTFFETGSADIAGRFVTIVIPFPSGVDVLASASTAGCTRATAAALARLSRTAASRFARFARRSSSGRTTALTDTARPTIRIPSSGAACPSTDPDPMPSLTITRRGRTLAAL
mmetsp:Transcript_14221/g.24303  ORF Transcript_14221/g.24303 Transcript_14221/m.24303 type:complete len:208 (-) Transcript_14221:765-1388(-)